MMIVLIVEIRSILLGENRSNFTVGFRLGGNSRTCLEQRT
jgi:hypothetical protein